MDIDKAYNDFVQNIAPKIADGLTITKAYFADVSERFVSYLIVADTLDLVLSLAGLFTACFVCWRLARYTLKLLMANTDNYDSYAIFTMIASAVSGFIAVVFFVFLYSATTKLAKTVYVPEVRAFEYWQARAKK